MSAIQSLLRVMTLRDAEAIVLETDKVPSLRRRGLIEKLSMPAIEAQMLTDFAVPLLGGRALDDGAVSVTFRDAEGATYQVAIDKAPTGLRVVVRPGKPVPATSAPSMNAAAGVSGGAATGGAASAPWWAQGKSGATGGAVGAAGTAGTASAARVTHASTSPPVASQEALARLARLLAPFVALAVERNASDILISTGLARIRVAGQLEAVDLTADDPRILREGAVSAAQVAEVLGREVPVAG